MIASPDRTTKVLLTVLALGIWALVLRPFFTLPPAQAQQAAPAAPGSQMEDFINPPISPNPSVVSVNGTLYVAGDGYVTAYTTDTGTALRFLKSEKLPSRNIHRLPTATFGTPGGSK